MRKRAAIYARVSTVDQHAEIQIHALRAYADARGFDVVEEFTDEGVSGTRTRRPALDKLLNAATRRRFDAVLVTKIDRLARSVKNLCDLTAEFDALNIDLCFVEQALDSGSPSGRMMVSVLGAIAAFEVELIRERTTAGLAAARRRGVVLGGRKPVLDRKGRERVRRLRRSGKSLREIAVLVDVSVGTVHAATK